MDDLVKEGRSIQVKIAGNGPLEVPLKQQVELLGLQETVTFVGAMAHDQVAGFISSLDVFVLPCKKDSHGDMDGIPVVLMEAMLCEVPVISTNISGVPELVIHNHSGLTVSEGNSNELAQAISQLMDSQDERLRLVNGGKQRVEEEFLLNQNVTRLLSFIQTSLTNRKR